MSNLIKDINGEKIVRYRNEETNLVTFEVLGFQEYYSRYSKEYCETLTLFYMLKHNSNYYALSATYPHKRRMLTYDACLEPVKYGHIYYRLKMGDKTRWKSYKNGNKDLFLNVVYNKPMYMSILFYTQPICGIYRSMNSNFLTLKQGNLNNKRIFYEMAEIE